MEVVILSNKPKKNQGGREPVLDGIVPTLRRADIDAEWFKMTMKALGLSQREMAKRLGMASHALISLTLQGQRPIPPGEAPRWARILGVDAEVLCKKAGINPNSLTRTKIIDTVKLRGWVDSQWNVHLDENGIIGPRFVQTPVPEETDVNAVRCQTSGGDNWYWGLNGFVVYFKDLAPPKKEEIIGKLCVVQLKSGEIKIATPLPSYDGNKYQLLRLDGTVLDTNATLTAASVVLWMKNQD